MQELWWEGLHQVSTTSDVRAADGTTFGLVLPMHHSGLLFDMLFNIPGRNSLIPCHHEKRINGMRETVGAGIFGAV